MLSDDELLAMIPPPPTGSNGQQAAEELGADLDAIEWIERNPKGCNPNREPCFTVF